MAKQLTHFITNTKNGNGVYYLGIDDPGLKRKWVSLRTKNKREAQQKQKIEVAKYIESTSTEKQLEQVENKRKKGDGVLFSDITDEFLSINQNNTHLGHYTKTARYFTEFLVERFGRPDVYMDEIKPLDYAKFIAMRKERVQFKTDKGHINYKGGLNTAMRCYKHLNTFFKWAKSMEMIPHNPLPEMSFKDVPKPDILPLTDKEIQLVRDGIPEDRYDLSAIFTFLLNAGIRRGELINLRWEDVYLDEEKPFFVLYGKQVKNKTGRQVALNQNAVNALRVMQEKRINDYVFHLLGSKYFDEPIRKMSLSRVFSRLFKRVGLKNASLHHCRHTYVTRLCKVNPTSVVQNAVGHSNIKTTMNYNHHDIEDSHQAVNGLSL